MKHPERPDSDPALRRALGLSAAKQQRLLNTMAGIVPPRTRKSKASQTVPPGVSPLARRLAQTGYQWIQEIEFSLRRYEGHAYTWPDLEALASRIEALRETVPGIMELVTVYEEIAEEDALLEAHRVRKGKGRAR